MPAILFPIPFSAFRSSFFALLLTIASYGRASVPYTPETSNPLYESWRWSAFDEISSKGMRCLAEGKQNDIWFGTADGVYQYNGLEWKHYASENQLLTSPVYDLKFTTDNILYVVTLAGICHMDGTIWQTDIVFPQKNVLGNEWEILNLTETADGDIWIGLYFGLIRIRNNKIIVYSTREQMQDMGDTFDEHEVNYLDGIFPEISEFIVFDLLEDAGRNLWFALEDGRLLMLPENMHDLTSPGNYTLFDASDGLLTSRLPLLFESSSGKIFMMTQSVGGGINIYDPFTRHWNSEKLSSQFGGDDLNFSFAESSNGTVWIGGLSRFFELRDNVWYEYKQPEIPVPQTRILISETKDGSIWLSGLLADIFRIEYNSPRWNTYKNLNYECETSDGTQWFISGGGNLVTNNPKSNSWELISKNEIGLESPLRIFKDRAGFLWVLGSIDGRAALAFNHTGSWMTRTFNDLCWGFSPIAAFQAIDSTIWFSASTDCGEESTWGLVRYDPAVGDPLSELAWKAYPGTEICEASYALSETDAGTLLCGYYKGLFEFGKSGVRPLHTILMNDIIKVEGMERDLKSGIWIGTRSKGIIHYIDENNWTIYSTDNGLPSNTISGILVSMDSTVWAATDKGICRFDGVSWQTSALPSFFTLPRGGGTLRQSADGTIWLNHNSLDWYRQVYFGITFDDEASPLTCYKIRLEDLEPQTQMVKYDEKVYYPGNTTIEWKGIDQWNQSISEDLTYSFKLDDAEWSEFSSETSHAFFALKRGKHQLQVRARDKFMNIDSTPVTIKFKRIPPVWGQVWFILMILTFVGTVSYLFIDTVRKSREMNVKNQEMAKKNDDLVMQQKEIEEKSTQIMKLLEAERENKWLNEGIVLIGEVIRKNKDNTRTLAQQLLSNLIQYLDVQYGGFFIYRKESDTNEYLELIASYGFDSHRNQERKILCNEGITGACFTEKKLMRIDNLPESYVIVSGLGKAKLNSLVLIPLKLHGDVTGVIEIAAVGNIGDKAVNLLETIAENIASNLLTLEAREQIEKLYKASQDQTARLHEQEEEMRQQMEELQATQEENHRREMKLLAEIEELKKLQKKK